MILDELATYLASTGVGYTTVGGTTGDIFKALAPQSPNSALMLFEYPGLPSYKTMQGGVGGAIAELPRVQIVCRGIPQDYNTPRTNAKAVHNKLDGLGQKTMTGIEYLWIEALSPPFLLERDENERVWIACNYQVTKRSS